MANKPRPATVIMVAFATGSVTIQCAKRKPEVIALMNVPHFNEDGSPVEVQVPSISETDVKNDARSTEINYRLANELIAFNRKDVVFWSVAEAVDPPMIQPVPTRILGA